MDNDLIVVMGASRSNKLMPEYLSQLEYKKIPYHVEPLQMNSPSDGTMSMSIKYFRQFAIQFKLFSKIVITDAWDVMLFGTKEDISRKIPDSNILFAAERNCYPEPQLEPFFHGVFHGYTPWKFCNGGMMAGTPSSILEFCTKAESHPFYEPLSINQKWINRRLAAGESIVNLDRNTELFYCMYRENKGNELKRINGRPWNSLCNTFPNFIHFNGSWPVEPFIRMMEAQ